VLPVKRNKWPRNSNAVTHESDLVAWELVFGPRFEGRTHPIPKETQIQDVRTSVLSW
jgi:hypothetical protein